ncbi:MAG: hypothetical protein AB7F35_10570 [Acetobacteraceae bacterium]
MDNWNTLFSDMRSLFIALNNIDHSIYMDSSEVRFLCTAIRNISAIIAVMHDYKSSDIKINANLHDEGYIAAVYDIHRTFLSGLHIYFEQGIIEWAQRHNVSTMSSKSKRLEKVLAKYSGIISSKDEKELRKLVGNQPSSGDIVEAVVSRLGNDPEVEAARKFLKGLAIIRNKVSHSRPELSDSDIRGLNEGGFGNWITGRHLKRDNFARYDLLVRRLVKLMRDIDATRNNSTD